MSPVSLFLLAIAGIFLIGVVGEILFRRTGVPDVLWLVLAGVLLGPVAGAVRREHLAEMAPYFAALTLVVILFDGGIRLRLKDVSRAAPRSGVLALLGFAVAIFAVAWVSVSVARLGWLPESWSWMHGLLLGAILGGSSSIIIMPAMIQAKVEPKVANVLNLESAFTDALCVVGATAMIQIILAGPDSAASPALALARTFGIGLLVGAVAGGLWLLLLKRLHAGDHAYPITLSALLILYVIIQRMGGSAALGILAFAVIVGNANDISSMVGVSERLDLGRAVRGVHAQIAFIVKSFFFTFIGVMLGPPWGLIGLGALLGVVLFVTRLPVVWLVTLPGAFLPRERGLIAVAFPRGMAAGVLATLPAAAGVPGTEQMSTVVFACVVCTVLIFAIGFPMVQPRGVPVPAPDGAATAALSEAAQAPRESGTS